MSPATLVKRISPAATHLPTIVLFVATLLGSVTGTRFAHAQYMYLDSNGDGVHTAADVVTATGTTTFQIWLSTNTNRDGTTAVCSEGDDPLGFSSYVVALRALGGTISWGTATNLQPTMGIRFYDVGNSTEYVVGYCCGSIFPPGKYRLAQFSVAVTGGAPSIEIVGTSSLAPADITSFGSPCVGLDFDNTMKLGSDWSEVDGLAYSSGGSSNLPPTIAAIQSMVVLTGDVAAQDFTAVDQDGDVVSLSLQAPAPIPTLTLLQSIPGLTSARLRAAPRRGDVGNYTATVTATDGGNTATAFVSVSVTQGPAHLPTFHLPPVIRMIAGTALDLRITASDSDGDPIAFEKSEGPAFARVVTQGVGVAATAGRIYLRPTVCDLGTRTLAIRAVAGDGSAEARTFIEVMPASAPAAAPPAPLANAYGVATGDFDGDGIQDAAVAGDIVGRMVVFKGDGAGGLTPIGQYPLGRLYVALESGDWNSDGKLDLAAGSFLGDPLKIFYGVGGGAFATAVDYPEITGASELRTGDVNGDGRDDLVASSEGSLPAVLLGTGNAGLVVASRIPAGGATKSLALGDFDSDGNPDVAFAGWSPSRLTIFRGRGDGTFGSPLSVPAGFGPFGICSGDFNEDGNLDLATSAFGGNEIVGFFGDGNGGFSSASVLARGILFWGAIVTTDWNADGHLDLYGATESPSSRVYFGQGDGTFADGPIVVPPSDTFDAAIADMNADGRPDLVVSYGVFSVVINQTPFAPSTEARAFQENPTRAIPITTSSSPMCLRLEPVGGAFTLPDVDRASVRLRSPGTGTVESIPATAPRGTAGDTDGNSIQDFPVCFAMSDVSNLFSRLHGKQSVETMVDGALVDGRRFCSRLTLTIIGKGTAAVVAARVEPNPFNPEGTLLFDLARAGQVSVRLFDLNGRLVRTLLEGKSTPAGTTKVRIDGKDAQGRSLRSGVYFFRIEGAGVTETGRFTILK